MEINNSEVAYFFRRRWARRHFSKITVLQRSGVYVISTLILLNDVLIL